MIEPKPPPSRMPRISSSTRVVPLRLAAREDHDAAAVEGALHDVADALGERRDRDALPLVDLLRGVLLDVRGRRLHLDRRARRAARRSARRRRRRRSPSRPPSRCPSRADTTTRRRRGPCASPPRRARGSAAYISLRARRGRVDREADRRAAEAQRVVDAAGDRRGRIGCRRRASRSC